MSSDDEEITWSEAVALGLAIVLAFLLWLALIERANSG